MKRADYVFETSWEICNKVGGIHTVISTKAQTAVHQYQDDYICIGPDLPKEKESEFIEDFILYKKWKDLAASEGLKIRVGRWKINGNPLVFLVDFTPFFAKKDEIFTQFWLNYKLDSISGQWDYIEPALFGYTAGRVIESFYNYYCHSNDKIIAHFHEWMTGTGILHLKEATPQIATVFTTHATALGRAIAGNGLPLYDQMTQYKPLETAISFQIQSKFSLEKLSAQHADIFTTVSEITNNECVAFFEKPVDVLTINGFENQMVPKEALYTEKRNKARKKLIQIAEALTQQKIAVDALLVINSGRYEFKNKGIDLFIEALAMLKNQQLSREVVAFIAVPAGNSGARYDLIHKINTSDAVDVIANMNDFSTHLLHNPSQDPVINHLMQNGIDNSAQSKIKVVFVPVYLDGDDGVFDLTYYDFLIGFDLSVFPSYYEPWGYTPLESVAFGIPTVTTSLAGFGAWVLSQFGQQKSAVVIERNDTNNADVVVQIAENIKYFTTISEEEKEILDSKATQISQKALWENLYDHYLEAYSKALKKSELRYDLYKNKVSRISFFVDKLPKNEPNWVHLSVKSNLTAELNKLDEIAQNLWWSWSYEARELFEEIAGKELWHQLNENPTHVLQMLSYETIRTFSKDKKFLAKLNQVYQDFQNYLNTPRTRTEQKVAYFSMEFGISNELKIFSGGLGMLAGDYLKEASDSNVDMIGVGLLYRYGYFTQQIGHSGDQMSLYPPQSFSKLPIIPEKDEQGNWRVISIALPGRTLYARIWKVKVGRIPLYLLDTDFECNNPEDRQITYNLYGGDIENRLKQEMLLGIGGVRMLHLLGENPEIFHMNEGHAAFLAIERLVDEVKTNHHTLNAAIEIIRASTLFTTHTPVPAGHDAFTEDLMRTYFSGFSAPLNITWDAFMAFGRKDPENNYEKFSMSILACNFAQEMNGVSKIHGKVTRDMFANLFEGHFKNELHIGYVTNGVHYPTWTHKKWQQFHQKLFGDPFISDQSNPEHWNKIYSGHEDEIWSLKQELRGDLIDNIKELLELQMRKRNESPSLIHKTIKAIQKNTLTIGFARRFATYKRAHLLFTNEERLKQIVNNPLKPIQFIFAGKAHPNDKAGQDLIKKIIEFSRKPDFIGKIIFLENYDMILAKKLISGCDVWLNNPTRPLEASGTSGEKAIMNGVLNFSVLDGWWAEGFKPGAGWAIDEEITYQDHYLQDELDASTLYSVIDEQISTQFYQRDSQGIPTEWVQMMKENFALIAPHFTMKRQLDDYYSQFYSKLEQRSRVLKENHYAKLHHLLHWKEKVITSWDQIEFVDVKYDNEKDRIFLVGEKVELTLQIRTGNLSHQDLRVELCVINAHENPDQLFVKYPLTFKKQEQGISTFVLEMCASFAGSWKTAIRIVPYHELLPHAMDFNLVKWI